MQFIYYKNKILRTIAGDMPQMVLLWYILLGMTTALVIAGVVSVYYDAYFVKPSITSKSEQYKPIIDKKLLGNLQNITKKAMPSSKMQ